MRTRQQDRGNLFDNFAQSGYIEIERWIKDGQTCAGKIKHDPRAVGQGGALHCGIKVFLCAA
jgi:hypothetical protein